MTCIVVTALCKQPVRFNDGALQPARSFRFGPIDDQSYYLLSLIWLYSHRYNQFMLFV